MRSGRGGRKRGGLMLGSLLALVCTLLHPGVVQGFSMGAPESACGDMLPGHNAPVQKILAPYTVSLMPVPDTDDRRLVKVTLAGQQGQKFAGYLLQARPVTGGNALGSFEVDSSVGNTHTCGVGLRNAVTHKNKTLKDSIEVIWEAPDDFEGIVVFNATVVRDYSTYWVGVRSDKLKVTKRSAGDSGLETSSRRPVTTPRIRTTKTPATTTDAIKPMVSPLASGLYAECGSTKGCFGFPEGCLNTQNCRALVSYLVRGESYEFELRAEDRQWVAVALSDDRNMADDSVMECTGQNNKVELFSSWNEATKGGNHRVEIPNLKLLNSSLVDGMLYCKFSRPRITTVEGREYDLAITPYYLLLAAGNAFKPTTIGYHFNDRDRTSGPIALSDVRVVEGASKILVHLHGAFMLVAWIFAASCGILLARYFKQTWVGSQLCGKDQWFAWHRMFMVLTWLLTVAGFIIIFIELGEWSSADNPHAILGCITTGLAFIQPFMAALRPAPNARRRPLFNWMHWLVGNLAHIFAIITIFFAVLLPRAELPDWMNWVLVGYVAFHVFMHLVLSIAGCASDRQGSSRVTSFPMKDLGNSRSQLHHGMMERKQDAPYYTLRKVLLFFYILGVSLLAAALVVMVVLSPIEDKWREASNKLGL